MGIRGFRSSIRDKSGIPYCAVTPDELLQFPMVICRKNPIKVVIDGNNLCHHVLQAIMKQHEANCYDYLSVVTFVETYLNSLKSAHIGIDSCFYDVLTDIEKRDPEGKVRNKLERASQYRGDEGEDKRNKVIQKSDCLPFPQVCVMAVKAGVLNFFNGKTDRIHYGCKDPDRCGSMWCFTNREIAKYAMKKGLFVLTDDHDFLIFPVKGIISIYDTLENCDTIASLRCVVSRKRLLRYLRLSSFQLELIPVFVGDDFVKPSYGSSGSSDSGEQKPLRITQAVKIIRRLHAKSEGELLNGNSHLIEEGISQETVNPIPSLDELRNRYRTVKRKYDIDSYPEFPLSLLTDDREKEQEVYEACGISRSRGQSNQLRIDDLRGLVECYRTTYSSFLIDFIFVPRICLPVTLFFQNRNRKNGAVS